MTTTAAWPRPRPDVSSLVVERPNRASIATRIAHPLLRGTIGLGLATLARTGGHHQLEQLSRLGRLADLPATLLVPPHGTKRATVQWAKFRAEWLWHKDYRQLPKTEGWNVRSHSQ